MTTSVQSETLKSRPFLTHQVVAIMDEPEHVAAALSQLERKGFEGGDIKVLSGAEGAYWLDATGGRPGFAGRLIRFLRGNSESEQKTLARQAEELREGHILIGVHVRNAQERSLAGRILSRSQGHFIHFFGLWKIRGMAP